LVAVAVALGALLEIVDTSIVNVALTDMQATLGATLSQIGWVITSYGIANVIILPLSAWLGHRFGKKNYFLFSLVGFTLSSMLCGMSTSLIMLILARVLQGLTGGGLLAKAQAILFETFPREEQATAQGFFGAIVIAGPAIGPTLGGYIVTNFDWRWIFFINLPLGILATFMVIAYLPKDQKNEQRSPVDWLAIALLAVGIGSFQTFLEEGQSEDWFDSRFITALAVTAVVGLAAFVVRVLRSPHPVVDLRVLRYRSLWAGCILSVVVGIALYGALFSIPIFAQTILHYTASETGWLLAPGALASAFMMPIASKLVRTFDPRFILVLGALVLMLALRMLADLSTQTSSADLFAPLIVRAFGTVLMFLPLQLASLGPVPKSDVAAATGLFNLTRQLGGSIGVALLTVVLGRREAFHSAVLSEKLVSTSPDVTQRISMLTQGFMSKGASYDVAHSQALAIIKGTVAREAAVLSFDDTFWATIVLILCSLPLVFLLGRPAQGQKVEMGH
jgi:DHA2 family multidrug resistance protein